MSQIKTKFIVDNAVSNSKLAQMPANTIKGNNTGGTANAADLSVAQVLAMLNLSSSGSGFYISSACTTNSSAITSPSFTTFSNSPTLTFSPAIGGTYKVYCSLPLDNGAANVSQTIARIFCSSGSPTLLAETQGSIYNQGSREIDSIYIESSYTLVAGNTYSFDVQGLAGTSMSIANRGDLAQFFIMAELVNSDSVTPISAGYYTTTTGTASSGTPFNFDTQIYDTNSAVTTGSGWKFTAPVDGKYQVHGFINANTVADAYLVLYKNGSFFQTLGFNSSTVGASAYTGTISLAANDYIDLRTAVSALGWTGNASLGNPSSCTIFIDKVG